MYQEDRYGHDYALSTIVPFPFETLGNFSWDIQGKGHALTMIVFTPNSHILILVPRARTCPKRTKSRPLSFHPSTSKPNRRSHFFILFLGHSPPSLWLYVSQVLSCFLPDFVAFDRRFSFHILYRSWFGVLYYPLFQFNSYFNPQDFHPPILKSSSFLKRRVRALQGWQSPKAWPCSDVARSYSFDFPFSIVPGSTLCFPSLAQSLVLGIRLCSYYFF